MKGRLWYRGLRDGKEVVGWDLRRDRVHSLLRRMIPKGKSNGVKFQIERRVFVEQEAV